MHITDRISDLSLRVFADENSGLACFNQKLKLINLDPILRFRLLFIFHRQLF
jgi:hypothetical protein